MLDQVKTTWAAPVTRSRRAFALSFALLLAGLAAPGCASNPTTYGAKLAWVKISISPPEGAGAIEASAGGSGSEAWVIETGTWVGAKKRPGAGGQDDHFGVLREEFATLNWMRLEGMDQEADLLVRELRFVLDRDQKARPQPGGGPYRLAATTLYLIVLHDGRFVFKEFDATIERSVTLSL